MAIGGGGHDFSLTGEGAIDNFVNDVIGFIDDYIKVVKTLPVIIPVDLQ